MIRALVLLTAITAVLLATGNAHGQVGLGGRPPSERISLPVVQTVQMPALDNEQLRSLAGPAVKGSPYRFGQEVPVSLHTMNAGSWSTLPSGERVWRLRIESPGALSLSLLFGGFQLPPGAELYVYDDDRSMVLGRFGAHNNRDDGLMATQPVRGDALTLELIESAQGPHAVLFISHVVHAFRDLFGQKSGSSGASGSCNVDTSCKPDPFYDQPKRSVARVLMGGALCSGALINNTENDAKQYFLTANHCFEGATASTSQWVFWFNYEASYCGGSGVGYDSITGATLRTRSPQSDFCLVEIQPQIPPSYGVYFAGWDRQTTASPWSFGIHHPQGDVKKISIDDDPATMKAYQGVHSWVVDQWDLGTTEPGSSGSPLFNHARRIVGQLYAGTASCGYAGKDAYGRFEVSYQLGLQAYLDPWKIASLWVGHDPSSVDLQPLGLTGPSAASAGETVSVMVQTVNHGGALAGPYTFSVHLTQANAGNHPGTLIGTGSSNQTGIFPVNVTLPASIPTAHYHWQVFIDDYPGEKFKNNNGWKGGSVSVQGATTPDLVVTQVSGPTSTDPGAWVNLQGKIENLGEPLIASVQYRFLLSTDTKFDATDLVIATFSASAWGTAFSKSIPLPPELSDGKYYWALAVDTAPGELNTANNALVSSSAVTIGSPPALTAAFIDGPATAAPGGKASVTFGSAGYAWPFMPMMIKNGIYTSIYLSEDGLISTADTLVAVSKSYQTGTFDATVTVPANLAWGVYRWGLVVEVWMAGHLHSSSAVAGGEVVVAESPLTVTIGGPKKVKKGKKVKLTIDVDDGVPGNTEPESACFVYLSKDKTIDEGDQLIHSGYVGDGLHKESFKMPKVKKGKYYWGLIVKGAGGQSSVVAGGKVKVK